MRFDTCRAASPSAVCEKCYFLPAEERKRQKMFFSCTAGGGGGGRGEGGGWIWLGSRSPELLFCLPRASLTWVPPGSVGYALIEMVLVCNYGNSSCLIKVRLAVQPPRQQCARNCFIGCCCSEGFETDTNKGTGKL